MIKKFPNIWKRDVNGFRYPNLRLQLDWPQPMSRLSACNRQFLETLDTILAESSVPGLLQSDAKRNGNEGLSVLLVRLAQYLEAARRVANEEKQLLLIPCVRGRSIEYPFYDEHATVAVLKMAFQYLFSSLAKDTDQTLDSEHIRSGLAVLEERTKDLMPSDTALWLIELARRNRVPVRRSGEYFSGHIFGYGRHQRALWRFSSFRTSYIGTFVAANKTTANRLLADHALPVPEQRTVSSLQAAKEAAAAIGFPVVVKPQKTDKGTAVTAGINSEAELLAAFEQAHHHGAVLVERHLPGYDHRIVVVDGKARWVMKRMPAHIVGNGVDSIAELIHQAREKRQRDPKYKKYAFPVVDDPLVTNTLASQGYTKTDAPPSGKTILLRSNSNISTGGTFEIVTGAAHPDNLRLAERAADIVGLDIAGVDLLIEDISQSWLTVECGICEINSNPAMTHPQDPQLLLDYLTAGTRLDLRVPVVLVVGGAAASQALCRELVSVIRQQHKMFSLAGGGRVYQNHGPVTATGLESGRALRIALHDKRADIVLISVTPREIVANGVDIDYVDLALIASLPDDSALTDTCADLAREFAAELLVDASGSAIRQAVLKLLEGKV
ncbi:MAG: hypothetical protein WC997_06740 [Porticoccaceae bacterium]